jgi:hypothetical protein
VNEPDYVAINRCLNKGSSIKSLSKKRRLDDDVPELKSAKKINLTEDTTISSYGDTCDSAESHFAANADRSGHPSHVRIVALENIVATAIYLCPFAISEGVPCRWSGMPFDIENHARDSHDSE